MVNRLSITAMKEACKGEIIWWDEILNLPFFPWIMPFHMHSFQTKIIQCDIIMQTKLTNINSLQVASQKGGICGQPLKFSQE